MDYYEGTNLLLKFEVHLLYLYWHLHFVCSLFFRSREMMNLGLMNCKIEVHRNGHNVNVY